MTLTSKSALNAGSCSQNFQQKGQYPPSLPHPYPKILNPKPNQSPYTFGPVNYARFGNVMETLVFLGSINYTPKMHIITAPNVFGHHPYLFGKI